MNQRNQLIQQRIDKTKEFSDAGIDSYPHNFFKEYDINKLNENFDSFKETDKVTTAGRIMLSRFMGKAAFAHIQDNSGQLQIYVRVNELGKENYEIFKKLDIGDIIGVRGSLFKTHKGEKTILADEITLLSKSLRPLPEKFHGLKDTETRYRQRYVDLIMDSDVRDIFYKRSKIIASTRQLLDSKEFLEVETPMMHTIPGGATARPFITHHNTLDMQLYLRIAPELFLKRLLVGGFEKVYEINRNFRNEGISTRHNPEFTMLELYAAYNDYNDMMNICEEIVYNAAKSANNSDTVIFKENKINLKPPFRRITYYDSLKEILNTNVRSSTDEEIKNIVKHHKIDINPGSPRIALINELFETLVEPTLIQPTFIYDYPVEISPLTKRHRTDAELVERFELYITGNELANAYSELNDPLEQHQRFLEQIKVKEQTKTEEISEIIDYDFLRALEYGMPPAGGLGIGIDRLAMLVLGVESIRDIILFPQMRYEEFNDF